jgi:hypothetical protein
MGRKWLSSMLPQMSVFSLPAAEKSNPRQIKPSAQRWLR